MGEMKMEDASLTLDRASLGAGTAAPDATADTARLRVIFDSHYDFVWRSLRRLGVSMTEVDDSAQGVFLVALRKLKSIRPGSERAFLFQTALRVAADFRRARRRRGESEPVDEIVDPTPGGDELLDRCRARAQLDTILDELPLDLRAVFVLAELDEMTMAEIAELLGVPAGTIASRLRRARLVFRERTEALARREARARRDR